MGFSFIARSTNPLSLLLLLLLLFVFYFSSSFCHGTNSLRRGQFIRDGETITSQEERFALGFFGNSTHRYVGIWYNNVPTSIIWVANSRIPLSGQNGTFALSNDGNLAILDGYGNSTWSTNSSNLSRNSTAILLDNGNLIVSVSENNIDPDEALWQSFDHLTDTYLPDMRIYVNIEEGVENRVFTSWTSPNDPSPGRYSLGVDPRGSPQIVIWEGQNRHWRSGHWNGLIFTGLASTRAVYLYGFRLLRDGNERLYFTYTLLNRSDLIRFRVISSGMEEQTRWNESTREWNLIQSQPQTECDIYNKCGAFGICNMLNSPICSCVQGFVPREIDQWNRGNWSGGCVSRSEVSCGQNRTLIGGGGVEIDQFLRIEGVKLPDFLDFVGAEEISDCAERCSRNCSCGAYAFVSGINCMMWSGELVDVQQFEESGNTLYVRIASSELGGRRRITNLVIAAIVVAGTVFLSISIWLIWRFRSKLKETLRLKKTDLPNPEAIRSGEFSTDFSRTNDFSLEGEQNAGPELAMYNFAFVAAATENFSNENKLGQGGFGPVYKGNLPGGQEIAVKRLSRKSGQGLEEFKNEITLIAKLQHRNLVRLLGCCIQGEEKMLLYEYMINKSLDSFIFDSSKKAELDWKKRFMIIEGIARGLIYLHRDSRLRIIHRDLKASNILLDQDMNPKISDFGMARIFGGNQTEANTNRVMGTYGYMAPEYAMEGLFSVKSDVYSFGVLLLEIISGRKNTSFRSPEFSNVIGYAWELWEGGRAMDLIDPTVVDSCCPDEALRCLHVAMLCVQDSASYRPTMASVVLMLGSESTTLPFPKQPTFRSMRRSVEEDLWKESHDNIVCSNGLTVTMIDGR